MIGGRVLALSLSPFLAALVVLILVPNAHVLGLSVFQDGWTLAGFPRALNEQFYASARTTTLYTICTVGAQIVLGLCAASVVDGLWRAGRRQAAALLTFVLFIPYTVPSIVVKVMWDLLLRDRGLLALGAERVFDVPATDWMGQRMFWTVVAVSVWQFFPFVFMAALAQMRAVPLGLYKAAAADGAGLWQRWRHVTWPAAGPTIGMALLLRTALMFTKFDTPYLLAGATASDQANVLTVLVARRMSSVAPSATLNAASCAVAMMALLLALLFALLGGGLLLGWGWRRWSRLMCRPRYDALEKVARPRLWHTLTRLWHALLPLLAVAATVLTAVLAMLPFGILALASVLPSHPQGIGIEEVRRGGWTLEHHASLWNGGFAKYAGYFWNTMRVSFAATITVLLLSLGAAYGLTRARTRWRTSLQVLAFWAYSIPPIVLALSYSILLRKAHLYDTLWGLVLANVALCLPFGLSLMMRYLDAVPRTIDMAAAADGASWWQTLSRVLVRRVLPGAVTVGAFTFILSWNDVAFSLTLTSGQTNKTLPAGVFENIFGVEGASSYGEYAAASLYVVAAAALLLGLPVWLGEQRQRAAAEVVNW